MPAINSGLGPSGVGVYSADKPVSMKLALLSLLAAAALASSSRAVESRLLPGHQPALVADLPATGPMPATTRLRLALGLPLRQPERLEQFLQELYDPASPNFRAYLTPATFTATYGPTPAEYQAVLDFADAAGFRIVGTHENRMLVEVEGRVDDIERAFGVKLQAYDHPYEPRTFFAPDREPTVTARAPLLHVSGLTDFVRARPMMREVPAVPDGAGGRAIPRIGSAPDGSYWGRDFRTAYVPGFNGTGTGQAVGLFELDGYFAADIAAYAAAANLPSVPLSNVLIGGFNGVPSSSQAGSGNEEVALDIEMVISMAPGLSRIYVYEGSPRATMASINAVLNRMATDNLAKQLSCSWGFEIDATTHQIFQQYAAQGQSFFLASGDSGAFGSVVVQPSDHPLITVVGGTVLTTSSFHDYVSETAWRYSGGGISTVWPIPDWQQGVSMASNQGSTAMRNLPDVAMVASNIWVVADNGRSFAAAGTSAAAPLWAAYTALVNQQGAASGRAAVGFLNPALYAIGRSAAYAQSFRDITTGANTTTASPNRFLARSGFDLCTGWGTPRGVGLMNQLLAPPTASLLVDPPVGLIASRTGTTALKNGTQVFRLSNAGAAAIDWAAGTTAAWLHAVPASGRLEPGAAPTLVTVSVGSEVTNLLLGNFTAAVTFTNLNESTRFTRSATLLLGNGGFEGGDLSEWSLSGEATKNLVTSVDNAFWLGTTTVPGADDSRFVHAGIYGAIMGQSGSVATLSRTLRTVPGQLYRLSFWYVHPLAGNPNQFTVSWNGQTLFDQSNLPVVNWTRRQFLVPATSTGTSLRFASRDDPNAIGLDDVQVEAVPMPTLSVLAEVDGGFTLHWPAMADVQYQVQATDALPSVEWQNLGVPITIPASQSTASFTVTPSAPWQFYRVLVAP